MNFRIMPNITIIAKIFIARLSGQSKGLLTKLGSWLAQTL
jgi:hypothetical protein